MANGISKNPPIGGFFYYIAHASLNSYVPETSVQDTPAGAYIMQFAAGFDVKHEFAVPAETVSDGHVVATDIAGALTEIYPAGHSVDGVAALATNGMQINKKPIFFISFPLSYLKNLAVNWHSRRLRRHIQRNKTRTRQFQLL